MLGIEVPERARVLRVLVAELSRVAHHLLWLAATAKELGEDAAAAVGFAAWETVLGALESYSGARMHLMVIRVGGLRADAGPEWLARLPAVLSEIDSAVTALTDAFEALADRTRGLRCWLPHRLPTSPPVGPSPALRGSRSTFDSTGSPGSMTRDEVYQRLIDGGVLRRATASAGTRRPGSRSCSRKPEAAAQPSPRPPIGWRSWRRGRWTFHCRRCSGFRGPRLRRNREPHRNQRLVPRIPRRTRAVSVEATHRVLQQRAVAERGPARHGSR